MPLHQSDAICCPCSRSVGNSCCLCGETHGVSYVQTCPGISTDVGPAHVSVHYTGQVLDDNNLSFVTFLKGSAAVQLFCKQCCVHITSTQHSMVVTAPLCCHGDMLLL